MQQGGITSNQDHQKVLLFQFNIVYKQVNSRFWFPLLNHACALALNGGTLEY